MTTETKQDTRDTGIAVLVGAAAACGVAGLAVSIAGALVSGSPAAYGGLVGSALVVTVFGFSSVVVYVAAGLMPTASLMIAMLTYTLQVVLMGLVFAALSGSGLLETTLSRSWLAGAVIAGTAIWLVCQVILTSRRRIPIYDLTPSSPSQGGER